MHHKDPDKTELLHIKDKVLHMKDEEELDTVMFRSIMISGAYNDSMREQCITEKRNDLLGQEPTIDPVT